MKTTILAHFASALINGDQTGLDDDEKEQLSKIETYIGGEMIDAGEEFFGTCEATGLRGTVCEFTYLPN